MKQPLNLLLVDNLDDGLASLKKSLSRKYETVLLAHSKDEAIHLYSKHSFDIVIVALEMYKNEGYRTITAIHDAKPEQRILTYSEEPENPSSNISCEVCMQENRRHRIRKPIQLHELYHEIENFDTLTCREAQLKKLSS